MSVQDDDGAFIATYHASAIDTWVRITVIDVHITPLSRPASFTGT